MIVWGIIFISLLALLIGDRVQPIKKIDAFLEKIISRGAWYIYGLGEAVSTQDDIPEEMQHLFR